MNVLEEKNKHRGKREKTLSSHGVFKEGEKKQKRMVKGKKRG